MSFYVTLPSNSSMNIFPNNTATQFTTQLKIPIKLDMPYEVALVEINYNHSWHYYLGILTFVHREESHEIMLSTKENEQFSDFINKINREIEEIYIPIELKVINDDSKTREKKIQDIHDKFDFPKLYFENNKLRLNCPLNSYFHFHGPIAGLLSLKEYEKVYLNRLPIPIRDNIFSNIQAIYVYTDIIDFQFVGDSFSPLLQTVITNEKNYASIVSVKYESPHYVPVNKTIISSINIDLRDDLGNKILFQDGKTIVKLHFRPKRYGL